MVSNKKLQVPELDFQKFGVIPVEEISDELATAIGRQFLDITKRYGCVQLTNHGFPSKLLDDYLASATEYFALPDDIKLRNPRNMDTLEGYTNAELESVGGNPDESKESYTVVSPNHVFPYDVPALKTSSANMFHELVTLSQKILKILEAGLGLSKNALLHKHDPMINGATVLRMLNYPIVPESIPAETVRCGAHCDRTTITLQFQYSLGGFQILHDNEWKYADVDRSSILVLYGKSIEYFTGKEIMATQHRVVVSGDEQRKAARRSVVFCVMAGKNKKLTNLISSDETDTITVSDFMKQYFSTVLQKPE